MVSSYLFQPTRPVSEVRSPLTLEGYRSVAGQQVFPGHRPLRLQQDHQQEDQQEDQQEGLEEDLEEDREDHRSESQAQCFH